MARDDECCVKGCSGSAVSNHLHKFPKNQEFQKRWLDVLNYDYLRHLPPHLLENKVVCHKHFEARSKSKKMCHALKRTAIPTLFLDAATNPLQVTETEEGHRALNQIEQVDLKRHDENPADEATLELHFIDTITKPLKQMHSDADENIKREEKDSVTEQINLHDNEETIFEEEDFAYKTDEESSTVLDSGTGEIYTKRTKVKKIHDGGSANLLANTHLSKKTQSHMDEAECSLVYITVPNTEIAKQIGRALLQEDMAASVDVVHETMCMFKDAHGNIQEENKILLTAKTRTSKVLKLCEFVAANYPLAGYQVLSVPVNGGNPHYLQWIKETVLLN